MKALDSQAAIEAGGWDSRYAVTLAVRTSGDIGAALIDTNGDGADIDLDEYRCGPDGHWMPGNSGGGAGDGGASWSPDMVALFGRGDPGEVVAVEYVGARHSVVATDAGWWLFIAPSIECDDLPLRVT